MIRGDEAQTAEFCLMHVFACFRKGIVGAQCFKVPSSYCGGHLQEVPQVLVLPERLIVPSQAGVLRACEKVGVILVCSICLMCVLARVGLSRDGVSCRQTCLVQMSGTYTLNPLEQLSSGSLWYRVFHPGDMMMSLHFSVWCVSVQR